MGWTFHLSVRAVVLHDVNTRARAMRGAGELFIARRTPGIPAPIPEAAADGR